MNTIDLSEVFGAAALIAGDDARVKQRIEQIRAYADSTAAPDESLVKMAKFAIVVDDWMASLSLTATAIQCWSSMQKNYGVNVCTMMSMMSEQMLPSRVRGGYCRRGEHVCAAAGGGTAERAGGLEQQLRRRSGQVRVLSLRQLGQGLSSTTFGSGRRRFWARCWVRRTP